MMLLFYFVIKGQFIFIHWQIWIVYFFLGNELFFMHYKFIKYYNE